MHFNIKHKHCIQRLAAEGHADYIVKRMSGTWNKHRHWILEINQPQRRSAMQGYFCIDRSEQTPA